jgi:cell pole-organizing protein PopZ
MEDILSSIKKIIADDSSRAVGPRPSVRAEPAARLIRPAVTLAPTPTPAEEPEDVLELAQDHEAAADDLISEEALEASRTAFQSLEKASAPADVGGMTVEALARDLLRPLLKDWLDANLPEIVKTAVEHEVARISGRKG